MRMVDYSDLAPGRMKKARSFLSRPPVQLALLPDEVDLSQASRPSKQLMQGTSPSATCAHEAAACVTLPSWWWT